MTTPIGNDPNNRIYNDSGQIDPSLLVDDIEALIQLEGISSEATTALTDLQTYLGKLDTQYETLLAQDPSTLTPQQQQWMADVEALLGGIDTHMASYEASLIQGEPDSNALKALTEDIKSLQSLAESGPPVSHAASSIGTPSVSALRPTDEYMGNLNGYASTLNELESVTKEIENLLDQQQSIGLSYSEYTRLETLLGQKETLTNTANTQAAYLDDHSNQDALIPPGQATPDQLDEQLSALQTQGSTIDTTLSENKELFDLYKEIASIGDMGGPGGIMDPNMGAINSFSGRFSEETIAAALSQKQKEYDNIVGGLRELFETMATRNLTPEEQARLDTLMNRANGIHAEVLSLDPNLIVASDLEAMKEIYNSGYMDLARDLNGLISEYEDLKPQLDNLLLKIKDGTATPEDIDSAAGLQTQINSLLDDIEGKQNAMSAIEDNFEAIDSSGQRKNNDSLRSFGNDLERSGQLKTLDVDSARQALAAQKTLIALAADTQELMSLQETINGFLARIDSGEPPLSEEEWAQFEQAIQDYNTKSSAIDANMDAYLILLQSQMPTPDENGDYTPEQYLAMMEVLYQASQIQGIMSDFQAQNDTFLDGVSESITNFTDASLASGTPPDRAAELSKAISLLSYSSSTQTGINTHMGRPENRPLDLSEFEQLIEDGTNAINGYDKEIPLYDAMWDAFAGAIERAEEQIDLIMATMKEEKEQLKNVTAEINDVNAILNGDFSDDEMRAKIEVYGLTPEEVNALVSGDHKFVHSPESNPRAYLEEVKGVLVAEQDRLKTSESENLLLLQQAQKDASVAAANLAKFVDMWYKIEQDIFRRA